MEGDREVKWKWSDERDVWILCMIDLGEKCKESLWG